MDTLELLNYLNKDFTISVRDPLWKDILLTKELYSLFTCSRLQQQNNVRQLGPTYLSYPGATHTRLSHSLGVYHISRQIILSLLKKSLNSKINVELTKEGILSLFAASMLHDIGHFPYTHSLKDIVSTSHEALASVIILGNDEIVDIIETEINITASTVCDIIDNTRDTDDPEIIFYRNLLSGTIDPDKLDYLCRDAFYCGVPYGLQDVNYIFDHLSVYNKELCILETAASSIQNIIFSKYMMYKNVYWLDKVRSATAMVKQAIYLALKEEVILEANLFNLKDSDLLLLAKTNEKFEPLSLITEVESGKVYTTCISISFDKAPQEIKNCIDMDTRIEFAYEIYDELSTEDNDLEPYQIIVDIPESIHFESDMLILTENKELISFIDWNKIDFSQTKSQLRQVRIFAPDFINKSELKKAVEKICQKKLI